MSTYDDFLKKLKDSGIGERISEYDMSLAKKYPDAGISIIGYKLDYLNAKNEQERAAANAGAEQIRSLFGSYRGGGDGMDYIAAPSASGTRTAGQGDFSYRGAPEFSSKYTARAAEALDGLAARSAKGFSYDPAEDELYAAYRKQYLREGKRAAEDALGLAAVNTGGLGSSYAATAAAQANNRYAAALTDKLPELYAAAYDRYLAGSEAETALYKLYAAAEAADYERYRDALGQYNKDRSFDYGVYTDDRADEYRRFEAERELAADRRRESLDSAEREQEARDHELALAKLGQSAEKQRADAADAERKRSIELAKLAASYGDTSLLEALGVDPRGADEEESGKGAEDPAADRSADPDYVYVSNYGYMKWSVLGDLISKGKAAKIYNNKNGSYSYYYLD